MTDPSAARKAAERVAALVNGDISHGKTIEAVIQSALEDSQPSVLPPGEPSWPNREFSSNASYRAGVTDARLAFDKWRSSPPAVSTPPSSESEVMPTEMGLSNSRAEKG